MPEPRPGTCVEDTRELPDRVLNFIRTHPLMDSTVAHKGGAPVFYKRDVVFTNLVVDKVTAGLYSRVTGCSVTQRSTLSEKYIFAKRSIFLTLKEVQIVQKLIFH